MGLASPPTMPMSSQTSPPAKSTPESGGFVHGSSSIGWVVLLGELQVARVRNYESTMGEQQYACLVKCLFNQP